MEIVTFQIVGTKFRIISALGLRKLNNFSAGLLMLKRSAYENLCYELWLLLKLWKSFHSHISKGMHYIGILKFPLIIIHNFVRILMTEK